MAKAIRIVKGIVKIHNLNRTYDEYDNILRCRHGTFPFETLDGKRGYFFRGVFDNCPGVILED